MCEPTMDGTIRTIDDLKACLQGRVSDRRFVHSVGVAQCTSQLLGMYPSNDYPKAWNGFDAALFCGLSHDMAREMDDVSILGCCRENSIVLSSEEIEAPVLAHGKVSAHMVAALCGDYPSSWREAIEVHTTGCPGMDGLALALFCADFIEPSRRFMTDERRAYYLSSPSLGACAYRILCDMIDHWVVSGIQCISKQSLGMKAYLESKGMDEGRIPWLGRESGASKCGGGR